MHQGSIVWSRSFSVVVLCCFGVYNESANAVLLEWAPGTSNKMVWNESAISWCLGPLSFQLFPAEGADACARLFVKFGFTLIGFLLKRAPSRIHVKHVDAYGESKEQITVEKSNKVSLFFFFFLIFKSTLESCKDWELQLWVERRSWTGLNQELGRKLKPNGRGYDRKLHTEVSNY